MPDVHSRDSADSRTTAQAHLMRTSRMLSWGGALVVLVGLVTVPLLALVGVLMLAGGGYLAFKVGQLSD